MGPHWIDDELPPPHTRPPQVWATCLGMEWLMQALGGEGFELDATLDAWNVSLPLQFTPEARQVRCSVVVVVAVVVICRPGGRRTHTRARMHEN